MKKVVRYLLVIPAILVVLLVLSAASNLFFPQKSTQIDTLSDAEKGRTAEAIQLREKLGNAIWPGFGDAKIPYVLYNEEYAFLLNLDGEPPAGWVLPRSGVQQGDPWEVVPGDDFLGRPYYRQQLVDGVTPQAFTVRLGDQWAASMTTYEWTRIKLAAILRDELPPWLSPVVPYSLVTRLFIGDTDKYVSSLTHESFHAFVGLVSERHLVKAEEVALRLEQAYPWEDQAIVDDWQTELDLLTQALRATEREEIVGLTRQFLSEREERRTSNRLSTRLIDYEQRREWLEGLAKYVELESWRRGADTEIYTAHPATAELGDFHDYAGFDRAWEREVEQISRMAEDTGDGRFYYSGMAQAMLLDALQPEWKEGALTGGTTLEGLLEAAVSG